MLLFTVIIFGTVGYTLVYAAIKGEGAKIGGTPLWRAPWLPFVAAITGNNVKRSGSGSGSSPVIQPVSDNTQQQSSGGSVTDKLRTIFTNLGLVAPLAEVV